MGNNIKAEDEIKLNSIKDEFLNTVLNETTGATIKSVLGSMNDDQQLLLYWVAKQAHKEGFEAGVKKTVSIITELEGDENESGK